MMTLTFNSKVSRTPSGLGQRSTEGYSVRILAGMSAMLTENLDLIRQLLQGQMIVRFQTLSNPFILLHYAV
jgi:hypothetical protein